MQVLVAPNGMINFVLSDAELLEKVDKQVHNYGPNGHNTGTCKYCT